MQTVQLLKKLIPFRTLSHDHQANREALAWVKNEVKDLPVHLTDFSYNDFPSLLITTQPTKTPHLWLQAHLDVVDGSNEIFVPKEVGQRLYGRGAFDMKFALATYLSILKELKKDLKNYDFGLMITTDEELGGRNGVGELLNQGYKSKVCVLPDGGENWHFQEWAKGLLHLKITSKGVSAHGAKPWKGKNAIGNLLEFLIQLKKEFPQEPCADKLHRHNTMTIGKINGGKSINQVSNHAEAHVDIRYVPECTKKDIFKTLLSLKKDFKNILIGEVASASSYKIKRGNLYLRLFAQIAKKYNTRTGFSFSHGSSDARYFLEKNIPTILLRPKGGNLHAENEWIDTKDLDKFHTVLKEFVEKTARI